MFEKDVVFDIMMISRIIGVFDSGIDYYDVFLLVFVEVVNKILVDGYWEFFGVVGKYFFLVYVVDICLYDFEGNLGLVVVVYYFGDFIDVMVVIFVVVVI